MYNLYLSINIVHLFSYANKYVANKKYKIDGFQPPPHTKHLKAPFLHFFSLLFYIISVVSCLHHNFSQNMTFHVLKEKKKENFFSLFFYYKFPPENPLKSPSRQVEKAV